MTDDKKVPYGPTGQRICYDGVPSHPFIPPSSEPSIPADLKQKVREEIALVRDWYEGHSDLIVIEELAARSVIARESIGRAPKQIYVACIDEIPTLSTVPHEIADPISSEDVVAMWDKAKDRIEELVTVLEKIVCMTDPSGVRKINELARAALPTTKLKTE
ncbi:MAG TPA: hypothetical protein VGF75_00440 [Candidatus Saccharimonadales bacterium]|jgi:hypothetical protein